VLQERCRYGPFGAIHVPRGEQMIVQVIADAGMVRDAADTGAHQDLGGTDAGTHQKQGTSDGARTKEDHLRAEAPMFPINLRVDARHPVARNHQRMHLRLGNDAEIGAPADRIEIRIGSRDAPAGPDGE
jgi:hypothetical protein